MARSGILLLTAPEVAGSAGRQATEKYCPFRNKNKKRVARLFSLLVQLICEAIIKGKAMRSLIDTWASVYLIREYRHKRLRLRC